MTVVDQGSAGGQLSEHAREATRATGLMGGPATVAATGAAALIRHWRLLLFAPMLAAAIVAVIVLVVPQRFESTFSIVPTSPGQTLQVPMLGGGTGGGLAAIAQGLGFGSMLGTGTPLEYFSDLVKSRRVTETVLRAPLPPGIATTDSARDLLGLYNIHTGDSRKDLDAGYKVLAKAVVVTTDPQSGIMSVAVSGKSPAVAVVMAHLFLDQLKAANSDIQREYAEEQAVFLRRQTDDAHQGLTDAENELLRFYQNNRTFQSSPLLTFEESRLRRQVDMAQSLYLTLAQELQQEQITAARDTPVFSVVDEPTVPGLRAFPRRTRSVILATLLCGFAAVGFILLQTFYLGDPLDRARGKETLRDALRAVRLRNASARGAP